MRIQNVITTAKMTALGCLVAAVGCADLEIGNDVSEKSQASTYPRNFGMHCTETFQNNWLGAITAGWEICGGFGSIASTSATQKFYYNLNGKQYYWHTTGDSASNSLEDVDLFMGLTHGGAWDSTYSEWGMWDDGVLATSNNMRLGDTTGGRRGTSIFATHSCHTLKWDGNFVSRWDSVFAGGLRIALGSHDTIYNHVPAEEDVGTDFATYLDNGWTFSQSWATAYDNSDFNNQDVAIAATGTSSSNCSTRRNNMSWDNFTSYSRLINSSVSYYCIWYWDNI